MSPDKLGEIVSIPLNRVSSFKYIRNKRERSSRTENVSIPLNRVSSFKFYIIDGDDIGDEPLFQSP